MSRIDELIERLCPDGVEYKPLADVANIFGGRDYKHLGEGDVPVYGSGGLMTYVDTGINPHRARNCKMCRHRGPMNPACPAACNFCGAMALN